VADAVEIARPIIVRVIIYKLMCIAAVFVFDTYLRRFPRASVSGIPSSLLPQMMILHSSRCLDGKYKSRPDTSRAALKLIACRRSSRRGGWTVVKKKILIEATTLSRPEHYCRRPYNNKQLSFRTPNFDHIYIYIHLFYSYTLIEINRNSI